MLSRMEEQIQESRNQQQREDQYRIQALGRKHAFGTAGAQLALATYGQQLQAALRQNASSSAGLGYFLQSAVKLFDTYQQGQSQQRVAVNVENARNDDATNFNNFSPEVQVTTFTPTTYTPIDSGVDYTQFSADELFNVQGGGAVI